MESRLAWGSVGVGSRGAAKKRTEMKKIFKYQGPLKGQRHWEHNLGHLPWRRWFASPLKEEEMSKVCEGYTPSNTVKNTAWAVGVFTQWKGLGEGEKCPNDLLEKPSGDQLNH